MQGGEELSIEELFSNLSTYKEQLQQVRQILVDEPGNAEYEDMEKELTEDSTCCSKKQQQLTANGSSGGVFTFMGKKGEDSLHVEVIALTEDLLATAKQNEASGSDRGTTVSLSPALAQSNVNKTNKENISDHREKFTVGTKVQAVWSEDGEWYDATIEDITPNGYFVSYDGWGNKEEVDPDNVRPIQLNLLLEAEKVAEATRQELKRKIEQASVVDLQSRSLPPKLRINAEDPEDVKAAKRKKIHAFKSKMRFEQLEVTQNKRQNAWQQFQTTKGKTKKVGFFSGRKKESIFKSPDDPFGKVGVTGSGKGLTEFQKREKHLHLKGGSNVDVEE